MKPFKTLIAAAAFALGGLACATASAASQEVLKQGFDHVGTMAGWTQVNRSTPAGAAWFQGNEAVFPSQSGAPDSYIAANYLGAVGGAGSVDNWLITPTLSLSGMTTLTFFTRHGADPGFTDTLEVRFAAGTGSGVDGFSTLLATIGGDDFPTDWQQFSASLAVDGPGRFAFRYLGDAANLNYIGLDSVSVVTAVPEPSACLMLALGLGALPLLRRRLSR